MTLKEMAEVYFAEADKIYKRAREAEDMLTSGVRGRAEHLRIKSRAALLRTMYRELRATGNYIKRYYDGGENIRDIA